MHLIDLLEEELTTVLAGLGYTTSAKLEISARPDLGDYQYNGSFNLAKEYRKNPNQIADEIIAAIKDNENIKEISNVGGFINITLSDEALIKHIKESLMNEYVNRYRVSGQSILIDYGGANVAKALHVGHLRPANHGEAIKRLFASCGYKTIGDVHLGDWGRPMGLIIREIKERMPDLCYFDENFEGEYPKECPVNIDDLNEIYPIASTKAKEDEDYLNQAREITAKLQNRHPGYYALWQSFYKLSVADIKKTYDKLNTHFDLWEGEYDADEFVPETIKVIDNTGLLHESEGAMVIDVKEETDNKEMPPVIIKTSAGGVTYATTDLATLLSRFKRFDLDNILYVTDQRQALHFTQIFRAGYKTGIIPKRTKCEHLGLGTMNGPDGKPFKTRDGGVLSLNGLIELVTTECRKVIKDNIKEEDKDALAEELAIAAIKYGDLLPNPTSDYIFDPVKFSDINGKTGPYLVYSTVRMNSLLTKAKEAGITPGKYLNIHTKEEREIILNILKIKSVLEKCLTTRAVNELAEFIYKLTSSFNAFYSEHEVLSEEDKEKQTNWVTLTGLVYDLNKTLLDILALKVPDKI